MTGGVAGVVPRGRLAGASFGTRLLAVMAGVVVGCAGSAWLVASVLAPEIFHDHLGQAGIEHDSAEAAHVEEAFTDSIVLALGLAVGVAVLLALLASWYLTRRVQRSVAVVTTSTADIAGGRYDTRVASPELGREFDDLATSVNELARRLGVTDTSRRRMLADLGHEMRTPLATIDSYLEAVEDGVRNYDDDTREVLWTATRRLERLASDTVDIDRMGQVLGNLLDNALRHTPAGGAVTVSTRLLVTSTSTSASGADAVTQNRVSGHGHRHRRGGGSAPPGSPLRPLLPCGHRPRPTRRRQRHRSGDHPGTRGGPRRPRQRGQRRPRARLTLHPHDSPSHPMTLVTRSR